MKTKSVCSRDFDLSKTAAPSVDEVFQNDSNLEGKPIPLDAKWTKIDRRLVNLEALKEAGEEFEEREDSVIVLRPLPRSEIQKLADRTREIREGQEDWEQRKFRELLASKMCQLQGGIGLMIVFRAHPAA